MTCHRATHHCEQPCSGEERPCPLKPILSTGLPSKVLHICVTANGEQRTLEIAASPLLDDDGQAIGIIEASRDITEHLALLDELKGGDEFTVILINIRRDEDAARVASKILNLFKEPFEIQGHGVFLGASIGISMYPQHGTTVDDLVRNADTAMYRAKEDGCNTFQYYSEELTARAFERVLLESSLSRQWTAASSFYTINHS